MIYEGNPLTVEELIEELKKYPLDAKVCIYHRNEIDTYGQFNDADLYFDYRNDCKTLLL